MHRPEKKIRDRDELEVILRGAEVGRLGTCVGGEPYVVPVNFAYDDGRIVFHCARWGKKLENIVENPRVCFEVDINGGVIPAGDPCNFSFRYQSIIAHGKARVHTDPQKVVEAMKLLVEKYASAAMADQITVEAVSRRQLAVVEITLEEMTGKRSPS